MTKEIRELEGVRYATCTDPSEIQKYVRGVAYEEWDPEDFTRYGEDLKHLVWELKEINVSDITFGPAQPTAEDLNPRIEKQLVLKDMQTDVPPLIVRASDMLVFDGYARVHAYRKLGIKKCLAYVGK